MRIERSWSAARPLGRFMDFSYFYGFEVPAL